MKIKLSLVILIICVLVLGTCSEWRGDEGIVNIRIGWDNGGSADGRSLTIPGGGDVGPDSLLDWQGEQYKFSDLIFDIFFVKEVVNRKIESPKKDNVGSSIGNVGYGKKATCSLVPGTWILIVNAYWDKDKGMAGQGVVKNKEIKSGKNDDIEIPMYQNEDYKNPFFSGDYVLEIGKDF